MFKTSLSQCRFLLMASVLSPAIHSLHASVITYVNNLTGNSVDFAAGVSSNGGGAITTLTFDTLTVGPLSPNAYSGLGITMNATNAFSTVTFGTGPGQGNTSTGPVSPGEGPHAASNYLGDGTATGTLTVSFASPVLAAGVFTIDLFNPGGAADTLTLSAYTGANGTGTLLGTGTAVGYNFQMNNLYFMGILSTAGDIGSVVVNQNGSASGDAIGLDNFEFAAAGTVPEPGTVTLMGIGLLAGAVRLRSRLLGRR
jgi:hypothetical protein